MSARANYSLIHSGFLLKKVVINSLALGEGALIKKEPELTHITLILLGLANLIKATPELLYLEAEQEVLILLTVTEVAIVLLDFGLHCIQDWQFLRSKYKITKVHKA